MKKNKSVFRNLSNANTIHGFVSFSGMSMMAMLYLFYERLE